MACVWLNERIKYIRMAVGQGCMLSGVNTYIWQSVRDAC